MHLISMYKQLAMIFFKRCWFAKNQKKIHSKSGIWSVEWIWRAIVLYCISWVFNSLYHLSSSKLERYNLLHKFKKMLKHIFLSMKIATTTQEEHNGYLLESWHTNRGCTLNLSISGSIFIKYFLFSKQSINFVWNDLH